MKCAQCGADCTWRSWSGPTCSPECETAEEVRRALAECSTCNGTGWRPTGSGGGMAPLKLCDCPAGRKQAADVKTYAEIARMVGG